MKKGDLCYIPQDVMLMDEFYNTPSGYLKTRKPQTAIVLEELQKDPWLKVFFQGEEWFVLKGEVYPIKEDECRL
tara:strand:- start:1529 stop:1750 length:222 start_codon:yes stop_codon:yes gene_type:complete